MSVDSSLVEEEKDRIITEYEKHVVQLQRGITIDRLRQKQILADRRSIRRRHFLEKLQERQFKQEKVINKLERWTEDL